MRVRKFTPLRIPSKNVARAVRFYREVFDLPTEFGENESRHLYFDQQSIVFEEVENHFINYYVTQAKPATESEDGRHIIFHLDDFEGNHIEVIANK